MVDRASSEPQANTNGMLPFYSVDTEAEATALLVKAQEAGLIENRHGVNVALELEKNQSIEALFGLGDKFAELDSNSDNAPIPFKYAPVEETSNAEVRLCSYDNERHAMSAFGDPRCNVIDYAADEGEYDVEFWNTGETDVTCPDCLEE